MKRYWIAINGSSCAICSIPCEEVPTVSPRPEVMFGFETLGEARAAQASALNDPIAVVKERMASWLKGSIRVVRFDNPEPQTSGETVWLL